MKRTKLIDMGKLICALFLFALLSSYKCNGQTNSIVVQDEVVQDDRIGILHNQLLDTVYNDLWKDKIAALTSGGAVKQARQMTAEEKESLQNRRADIAYNAMQRGIKNLLPDIEDTEIAKWLLKKGVGAVADDELQHLTPFQQEYYEKLMQLFKRKDASLEQVLVQIAELETEIVKNSPTTEEARQLLQVTSVSRYSAQYWAKNINKWMMLNSEVISDI
jgi:hypothetical protein